MAKFNAPYRSTDYQSLEKLLEPRVEKTEKYWVYHNVPVFGHNGVDYKVIQVTRELLFGGEYCRQEEFVKRLKGTELSLLTAPEYLSICAFINNNISHPDNQQRKLFAASRKWFKKVFGKNILLTGSTLAYYIEGSGSAIHGVGRENQYYEEIPKLVGSKGFLKEIKDAEPAITGIFNTTDVGFIDRTFREVTNMYSYLDRLEQTSIMMEQMPIGLGVSFVSKGFTISCYMLSDFRALGVVIQNM